MTAYNKQELELRQSELLGRTRGIRRTKDLGVYRHCKWRCQLSSLPSIGDTHLILLSYTQSICT